MVRAAAAAARARGYLRSVRRRSTAWRVAQHAHVQAFVKKIHAAGQRWVPISEPGIKYEKGYHTYDAGVAANAFIKDYTGKTDYIGQARGRAVLCACAWRAWKRHAPLGRRAREGRCAHLLRARCSPRT